MRELAAIRVRAWNEAYRTILPADSLRGITHERSAELFRRAIRTHPPSVLVLQLLGGPLVGYCTTGPQRDPRFPFAGEIYELYLLPEAQGRGWGRALLNRAIWQLVEEHRNPALVWALERNPVRGFYEACGARRVGRDRVRLGSFAGWRIAYGWPDTLPLPGL